MSLRSRLTDGAIEQVEGAAPLTADAAASVRDEIERHIHYLLVEELGTRIDAGEGSDAMLRRQIERKLGELLAEESAPLSATDRREITTNVLDNILGYGPIQSLIDDPTVTEVMVNNADSIYIER
ncbi:MAG: CpaF family protein, partial [Coriobacteriia bacterium]